jgi:hypothetical protein
MVTSKIARVS